MPRKCDRTAPPRPRFRGSLRICDPCGLYADDMPTIEPEVARFQVAGYPCQLLAWTAAEWESLSSEERPGDAFRGSRGSWFKFEQPADRQG